jgi:radical SAM family uncharacterized protein/radical SAM-linked protein
VIRLFDHPYAAFLDEVAKPTRYTGAEHGARQKDWSRVRAKVCLAFPDVYDIGMSHLGYRILYQILNDDERTLAERCYTPWIDLAHQLRERSLPLVSLESAQPLREFDVLGFSLQFELTYSNLLGMLDLAGIARRSGARTEADPLVIVGGPAATHAEPLADFVDAALLGDGEEALVEIALAWTEDREAGLPRAERLRRLSRLRGVYVPSLYATQRDPSTGLLVVQGTTQPDLPLPVQRRVLADLGRHPFPATGPVGGPETVFDRSSVEIARGCSEGCRFCQAGFIYRPVREREPECVVDTVLEAVRRTGQDEVGLTALSTADVSYIAPLLRGLGRETARDSVSLGVASLRAYGLDEELLDELRRVRASGMTFAPEAGTQRLRDVINKNVTDVQLLETAERVFARGYERLKLYFIIGLPTETDEDVLGIVRLARNVLKVGRQRNKRAKVTVSVSTHVPKPHTPFQWFGMDTLDEIRRKQALIRDAARNQPGLVLRFHDAEASVLEAVLARGDRRLGAVLERAVDRGAQFDSWEDQLQREVWAEAFAHHGIDPGAYLEALPETARAPWDHFDLGVERSFLLREYRRALRAAASPPCGKALGQMMHHTNSHAANADDRRLLCYRCGVECDMQQLRAQRIARLERLEGGGPVAAASVTTEDRGETSQAPLTATRGASEPASRWRLRYTKTGPAALLGHLDLIRELPRVLRRAGVRMAYTRGFHPKPQLSYSPALPLGAASLGEYLDAKLVDAPAATELVARLKDATGAGLRFVAAAELSPSDLPLSRVVTAARYAIALDRSELPAHATPAWLRERIRSFLQADEVQVERKRKRGSTLVNARTYVTELDLGDAHPEPATRTAGLRGEFYTVEARIEYLQGATLRPGELLRAVLDSDDLSFRVVRVGLLAGDVTPLDLDRLREGSAEPS